MTTIDIEAVRKRAHHYVSPEVAAVANMSVHDLQQFLVRQYQPSDTQLAALAARMGFKPAFQLFGHE